VHNKGAAITPEQLNGIFGSMKSRRQPGSAAVSGRYGNLGLGLYIAERIVHAHKGRIEVESSEDSGTTFTIRLPRRAADAPAA
jgi:signal transduction histidine kinase